MFCALFVFISFAYISCVHTCSFDLFLLLVEHNVVARAPAAFVLLWRVVFFFFDLTFFNVRAS